MNAVGASGGDTDQILDAVRLRLPELEVQTLSCLGHHCAELSHLLADRYCQIREYIDIVSKWFGN